MKRKVLACVLVCATLFLGMGYAAWTDSLQINTTAKSGDLEVKFVDLALFGQYGAEERDGWAINDDIPGSEGAAANYFDRGQEYNIPWDTVAMDEYLAYIDEYTKTSFTAQLADPTDYVPAGADGSVYGPGTKTSDGIKIDVQKMYPGYAQIYRTDIINIGPMAAKLSAIKLDMNGDNAVMKDMIGVSLKVQTESGTTISVLNSSDIDATFEVGGETFVKLSALNDPAVLDDLKQNILLIYPGDNTIDAYFGIAMDMDYDGANTTGHVGADNAVGVDAKSQDKDASFRINFLWDQFNTKAPN